MRNIIALYLFLILNVAFAVQSNTTVAKKKSQQVNNMPCVQAFLNADALGGGSFISKKSKGILTVSKNNIKNILFNVTLKSNIGKKDEPPVYLRFIKQKALDINELLEYAEDGDEIYIEEFVPTVNRVNLKCIPVSFMVE